MAWYWHLLVLALCLSVFGKSIKKKAAKTPFELEDFLNGAFGARSWNGTWISDNSFIFLDSNRDILNYNVETRTATKFLDKNVTANYTGSSISVSKDQKFVLIKYNVSSVFRHSTTGLYAIYDIENKKLRDVNMLGGKKTSDPLHLCQWMKSIREYYDVANKAPIQLAAWTPVGHGMIYVLNNNIYYLDNPTLVDTPMSITKDGIPGVIYNGVPDWIYEEEVLGTGSAIWFSPDGKRIAFAQFNDTGAKEFDYILYGNPGDMSHQYPTIARIKYPKSGTPNPVVQTYIGDLNSGEVMNFPAIPQRFLPEDYVLYSLGWVSNDEVVAVVSNRVQNEAELTRCNLDGSCRNEATYKEDKGWLDVKLPNYNKAGNKRIEILPQPEGDDFYNHLVLTDVPTKATKRLTQGHFVVTSIVNWDETKDLVYFIGSGTDGKYSQQHAYVVNVATSELICLTCDQPTPDRSCLHGSASFSADLSYYAKICSGPGPNFVQIVKSPEVESNKIPQLDFEPIIWQDNQALIDKWTTKLRPTVKDLKVPIPNTKYEATVRLLLPPNFDENTKYPAIANVYAGPDYNQITDVYKSGFEQYMTTNRNYIYVYIDGRGSGRDGNNKKFEIYRRLGTVEIQDTITAMKYLQDNLKYIDANRTGIWGWSYGGFTTAWVLAQDKENVFKFGLSVAPVSSFIYYDSIYTERYMGLPTKEDNLAGYDAQDVTKKVEAFRGKTFFLVHGNGDDNVHYQQSMLLSKALELADIPFTQQSYPDENHSLSHVSPHLYHTIDRFFARSMGLPDPPISPIIRGKPPKKAT